MADRATIFQKTQIAVEATPGTAPGSGFKTLQSLAIDLGVKAEANTFKPTGTKFATVAALGREWTTGKLSGQPTYDEIVYPLSSVLAAATITTPGGGTTSRQWVFGPASQAADTNKSFTAEQGDASTRAHRASYGLVTEFGLKLTRKEASLDGAMIFQALADGITLTAGATALPLIPAIPAQASIYLADTAAGLAGAAALTRAISAEWKLGDRFNPIWAINAANASFGGHVEADPKGTAKLKVAADATGMGLLTTLRAGATKFMRIEFVGATIEASIAYKLTIDTALKVVDVSEFSDEDGLFAIEWSFEWAHDATWGKAVQVTVINTTTAL